MEVSKNFDIAATRIHVERLLEEYNRMVNFESYMANSKNGSSFINLANFLSYS